MSQSGNIRRFTEEEEHDNERLARLEYGPELVNESAARWKSYSQAEKDKIMAQGDAIYRDMATAMNDGLAPGSPEVTRILDRWQQHFSHFYEPTLDIMRGLGDVYATNDDFRATFEQFDARLPEFLQQAIAVYVDELETQAIEQMLDDDDARLGRLSS